VITKADQLKSSRFVVQLIDPGFRIDLQDGGVRVTKPDDEARAAFVLTLRFFIVANEPTSFAGLDRLANDEDISTHWRESFRSLRSTVNEYLDTTYGEYEYGGATHRFSNREIMNTFLYGGLVHANNPHAVATYEEWTRYPGIHALLEMWFISTVQTLLRGILFLARLSETELTSYAGRGAG